MGYDLHITRTPDWSGDENEIESISLEEWLTYAENDPELDRPKDGDWQEGFFEWIVYPGEHKPWFDYSRGTITTKNPDEQIISKMLSIAEALNAKVQGDDGEIYDEEDEKITYKHPATEFRQIDEPTPETKPWWKFW